MCSFSTTRLSGVVGQTETAGPRAAAGAAAPGGEVRRRGTVSTDSGKD